MSYVVYALLAIIQIIALLVWAITWPIAWLNQAARRIVNPYNY